MGKMEAAQHQIELNTGAKPVHLQLYRAGPHRLEEIEKQVHKMLKMDVIEPSNDEWAFLVVVVPKSGGHFRFRVDYRRLNKMTVKRVYPGPRMDDYLDFLGDAILFSTLDCNAGYW